MTPVEPLAVAIGGALGATARHAVGTAVRTEARIPVSTLVVNAVGSFVLGFMAFGFGTNPITVAVGVGACGSFTTFSSFSYETVEALRDDTAAGIANAALHLVVSVTAVSLSAVAV